MDKRIKSTVKKILGNFNFIAKSKINGKNYKIPLLGNVGISNLTISEPWMVDLLKVLVKIDGTKFVDVGVNIGQTLLKLRSVDDGMKYLGFEPNPTCVFYVNKLIKVNNFKNIALYPVGISTHTEMGELNFYYESETDGSASIIHAHNSKSIHRKEYIPLFDISTLKNKVDFKSMSILKIDVEGAELEVIESFRDEIKSNNPFILMEILPVYNKTENEARYERQEKLLAALHTLGYLIFRIIKNKKDFISLQEIQTIEIHSDLNKCDYLFVPKIKLQKLKDTGAPLN